MFIDTIHYDKSKTKINSGWDRRVNGVTPKSLIIHTTNGARNSKFENEALYIYLSKSIGAHYLIGKDGRIIQFLDNKYRAHHAGAVNDKRFNNNNSIGIECHYTPGEGLWTQDMKTALTFLCKKLIKELNITDITALETHRKVATPKGRKIDPSGFIDDDFYKWRKELFTGKENNKLYIYKALFDRINIRQGPSTKYPIAGKLMRGDIITVDVIKKDELGESISNIDTWLHIENGIGFVHSSLLQLQ